MSFLKCLWQFSRPHTIIGTSLSVLSLYLLTIAFTDKTVEVSNLIILLETAITCLLGNLYIVGLNQLTDVEIDKINKPNLPLASGKLTMKKGKIIVALSGILSLILAFLFGVWLLATVMISLIIGTAYSLPPIRLKRFPFLASICIFTVRGIVVNFGLFLHFTQKLTPQSFINLPIYILTLFVMLFTIAIAIFKDVPDQEGDQKYKIMTFTILMGKERIFDLARGIISLCYLGIIFSEIILRFTSNSISLIIIHLGLLIGLWWRSRSINLESNTEIASFYQFIWKLFFLEYLIFPSFFLL